MRCHLDTSAAAKLLVEEVESDDLESFLERAVEGGDSAGLLPGASLRSLDALHVAAALRWGADAVVTYDDSRRSWA